MDYLTLAEEDDLSDRQSYYCQKRQGTTRKEQGRFATFVELQRQSGAKHSAAALGLCCQPCCFFADDRTKMQQHMDALHRYSNYGGSSHKCARTSQEEMELAAMDDGVERLSHVDGDGDGDGEEDEQPRWKRQRRGESNTSFSNVQAETSDANLRNNKNGPQLRWIMVGFDVRSVLQDIPRTPHEEEAVREAFGYCFDGERAYCEEV